MSWNSSKQKTVSLSSTESEYIALANAAKEALWLKQLLNELNKDANQTLIYCDIKSTICLAKNPEMHSRTKHIDIRYHFLREKIKEQKFKVDHLDTNEMPADFLTKGLSKIKHHNCMSRVNLKN